MISNHFFRFPNQFTYPICLKLLIPPRFLQGFHDDTSSHQRRFWGGHDLGKDEKHPSSLGPVGSWFPPKKHMVLIKWCQHDGEFHVLIKYKVEFQMFFKPPFPFPRSPIKNCCSLDCERLLSWDMYPKDSQIKFPDDQQKATVWRIPTYNEVCSPQTTTARNGRYWWIWRRCDDTWREYAYFDTQR